MMQAIILELDMDIFDILVTLPKSTIVLFNDIKASVSDQTGIGVMYSFIDNPDIRNIYTRLSLLIKADLIRKVIPIENPNSELNELKSNLLTPERYTYMINPYLIKPWKYELAKQIWDLIEPKD